MIKTSRQQAPLGGGGEGGGGGGGGGGDGEETWRVGRGRSCQVLQLLLWQFPTPSPTAAEFVHLKLAAVRKLLLLLLSRAWEKEKISESSTGIQPSDSVHRAEAHLTLNYWKTRGKLRHHLSGSYMTRILPSTSRVTTFGYIARKWESNFSLYFVFSSFQFPDDDRVIKQFHFTAWPDHGVPSHPTPLLSLVRHTFSANRESVGPMVVHCR